MSGITRRESLSLLTSYALVRLLHSAELLASPVRATFDRWVESIDVLCRDLATKELSAAMWQEQIETLLSRIPPHDLMRFIDFDTLEKRLRYPDLGVDTHPVRFPGIAAPSFHAKVFGMQPHRAIIPHGHRHMASAHLVLGGTFHLRQYERVRVEGGAWVVRPTVDENVKRGSVSSISDEKNNVHWLLAGAQRAYTLDVIVVNLDDGARSYAIQNLDPDHGTREAGGLIRMPALPVGEALRRYGKTHHT